MIKLTNREILSKVDILKEINNKKLPIKVSYIIAKNMSKIDKELEFYNNTKSKIIQECCLKDDNGNLKIDNGNYIVEPNKIEKWYKDNKDLEEIIVEIDIQKFKLELLDGYDMTPNELMCIDFMIEE